MHFSTDTFWINFATNFAHVCFSIIRIKDDENEDDDGTIINIVVF